MYLHILKSTLSLTLMQMQIQNTDGIIQVSELLLFTQKIKRYWFTYAYVSMV
ncbi:hypothetical protein HanIR_Chr06g0285301 [Helianthus annuus]|nr:hypothetical protein HanIR_Chr06g0285301 [Helianthus annuus]